MTINKGMKYWKAKMQTQQKRKEANPNSGFVKQLEAFYKEGAFESFRESLAKM